MSEKRRDNKGRLLRTGEGQRSDGRYEYRYRDAGGERRYLYSWKLVDTDKLPTGKRKCRALRDMEKDVIRDTDDGIKSYIAKELTLNAAFDNYIESKAELKPQTKVIYLRSYNRYIRDSIGRVSLQDLKYTDIRRFCTQLITKAGISVASANNIHQIIHAVLEVAVRDNIIRRNPSDGIMKELRKSYMCDSKRRRALTKEEQATFMDFVKNSKRYRYWLPLFAFFLGTGCRACEAVGLRWQDCDFEKGLISINHILIYQPYEYKGKYSFHITTPKTKSGIRTIPMFEDVRKLLLKHKKNQEEMMIKQLEVDGCNDFVFCKNDGRLIMPQEVGRIIDRIIKDYNGQEEEQAKNEGRKAILLKHFSPHQLRHTFCTRYYENDKDLKVLQEIMGHSNISVTMDVYNEAGEDRKIESFANLEGKIKIV